MFRDAAEARTGDVFNPDDPTHEWTDALRYAQWIQAARDAGDYDTSDMLRARLVGWGFSVEMGKGVTRVEQAEGALMKRLSA